MFRAGIPFLADTLRIFIVLAFYLVLRVLFIDYYADPHPEDYAAILRGGFRFDVWSVVWLSLPYLISRLFWQKESGSVSTVQKWIFVLPNAFGLALNCLDLEYFAYSKRRTTTDYFDIATGGNDIQNVFGGLFPDFLLTAVVFIVMLVLLISGYRKIGLILYPEKTRFLSKMPWFVLTLGLVLLSIRGGWQHKPITSLTAGQYTTPDQYAMVLNTPFTFLKSLEESKLKAVKYMPTSEANALWPVEHKMVMDAADLQGYNVVLVILESFSASMSGVLSGNESQMPFLDSLMSESIYFTNAYANGTRSIDALPALVASIPNLTNEAFIYSTHASTEFTSLPSILKEEGYESLFFHGGRNGTMGFDDFCKTAGFDTYYGLDEYGSVSDDDLGDWGIHDEPFMERMVDELAKTKTPYFAGVFSLSSHHPYELPNSAPEAIKRIENKLHRSIRYTDYSFKKFYESLAEKTDFSKTMLLVTADHTAGSGDKNMRIGQRYHVPFFIHLPGRGIDFKSDKVIQHIDLLPVTLDFLGYEKPFFSFGQDLRGQKEGAALVRDGDVYHFIGYDGILSTNGDSVLSTTDAAGNQLPLPERLSQRYFSRARAGIQQFNRHIKNRNLKVNGP